MSTRYAVVDLETTGPKFRRGERIIQIGAVFMEDDQIIDRYETYIQPLIPIPKRITQLTGITQRDVADAPLFEDIAEEFWQKLQGCVFVGHNVNFDFYFLRDSFEAAGYPQLKMPRIDTVELSRSFVPTADSYHLQDICQFVGITLDHAHTAMADAEATAELMLSLKAKIQKLPVSLMREIKPYLSFLLCETGEFVSKWYNQRQANGQYKGQTIEHLTFKKQRSVKHSFDQLNTQEPSWNSEQEALIEQLAMFYMGDKQFGLVTAKAGAGKSLVTAYASAVQNKEQQPIVIVTPTNLLLDQWRTQTIPRLSRILGYQLPTKVLISASHFISLDGFNRLLEIQEQDIAHVSKHDALISIAVLCWLFETKTGRLEELHKALRIGKFWQKVKVLADQMNIASVDWQGHDFYTAQFDNQQSGTIYLTNTAFLAHHADLFESHGLFDAEVRWIIDECHHLPAIYAAHQTVSLTLNDVSDLFHRTEECLRSMGDTMLYGKTDTKDAPFDIFYETGFALEHLFDALAMVTDDVELMLQENNERFIDAEQFALISWHMPLSELWVYGRNFRKAFERLLSELSEYQTMYTIRSVKWRRLLNRWQHFEDLMEDLLLVHPEQYVTASMVTDEDGVGITITKRTYPNGDILAPLWEQLPKKVLLISQNLPILTNEVTVSDWLGLSDYVYCEAPIPENYGASTSGYVIEDQLSIEKYSVEARGEMISQVIQNAWENSYIHKIQVFFHSRELLEQVEALLIDQLSKSSQKVLMTQTKDRSLEVLRTEYERAERAILLTLDSFQEGIHLASDTDTYIMTRLPFASPAAIDQQAMQYHLKQQERNYFTEYAMPEMLMLFNQWMGRVFRRDQQTNRVIMLDKRVMSAKYASQIQNYLPSTFTFEEITSDDLKKRKL